MLLRTTRGCLLHGLHGGWHTSMTLAYLGESAAAGGRDQRRVADEQHAEHCATRGIVSHIGVERGWRGSAPTAGGTVFKQS